MERQEIINFLRRKPGYIKKGSKYLSTRLEADVNDVLYAKFRRQSKNGVLVGIQDLDGDGKYDSLLKFGNYHIPQKGSYSTGARIFNGYLRIIHIIFLPSWAILTIFRSIYKGV